jgi:hypothetical protein
MTGYRQLGPVVFARISSAQNMNPETRNTLCYLYMKAGFVQLILVVSQPEISCLHLTRSKGELAEARKHRNSLNTELRLTPLWGEQYRTGLRGRRAQNYLFKFWLSDRS